MTGQRSDAPPESTRARALAVARELFVENGYAGTSIADIAERLGVTKAGIYYHFPAKADFLQELIAPIFTELQAVIETPSDDARTLLEGIVCVLEAQRSTIGLIAGDPSVAAELKLRMPASPFGMLIEALAGRRASNTRRLRARCALGAIHAAVIGPYLEKHAGGAGGASTAEPVPMTRYERRVVIDAALAVLEG